MVVVISAIAVKVIAQIEQWFRQYILDTEEQDNEQAPYAAVAVKIRVYRLELVVHQRTLHQRGHLHVVVDKALPIREQVWHQTCRWRHEACFLNRCAARPDPVLARSQLSRRSFLTSDSFEQPGV